MTTIPLEGIADMERTPPGPPPGFLLGGRRSAWKFLRDPVAFLQRAHAEYGPVVSFVRGRSDLVFVRRPEHIQQVLSDDTAFPMNGITIPGPEGTPQRRLGQGMLRMNGAEHDRQRKLLMPPMQRRAIEGRSDQIASMVDHTLAGWRAGETREVSGDMLRLSLRSAASVLFGLEDADEIDRLASSVRRWYRANWSPSVRLFRSRMSGCPYARMLRFAGGVEETILSLARRRRERAPSDVCPHSDVLSILLRDHREGGTTDGALVGQVTFLIGASHETTGNALAWTLLLLAAHPRIQSSLREELRSCLGGAPPRPDQLSQLPLLDRVVKESLRILPPAVYTTRHSAAAFQLGGFHLAAGTKVGIGIYGAHHLPEVYPNPERFDPGRWETIAPGPYTYLPFGAGPRLCMGLTHALQTMKTALALIVQRFGLGIVDGARVDRDVRVTMGPRAGILLNLTEPGAGAAAGSVRGNIREMVEFSS